MSLPPILMSPICSNASLDNHYSNRDWTLLYAAKFSYTFSCLHSIDSSWSKQTFIFCSSFRLRINLLSLQVILIFLSIFMSFFQFNQSNTFCQSMKQMHNSSVIAKALREIILSIPISFLISISFLKPNWSSPVTSILCSSLSYFTPPQNLLCKYTTCPCFLVYVHVSPGSCLQDFCRYTASFSLCGILFTNLINSSGWRVRWSISLLYHEAL